jgi:hypothetical protein
MVVFTKSYSQITYPVYPIGIPNSEIELGKEVYFNDVANWLAGKGRIYTEPSTYRTGEKIKFIKQEEDRNAKEYTISFFKNTQIVQMIDVSFASISTDSWDAKLFIYTMGLLDSQRLYMLSHDSFCGFLFSHSLTMGGIKSTLYKSKFAFKVRDDFYVKFNFDSGTGTFRNDGWYPNYHCTIQLNPNKPTSYDCDAGVESSKIIEKFW